MPTLSQRAAGVLLHPTSLPGPFENGDLGPSAQRFAEWLAEAGLAWWQTLPVGPSGPGSSPYSSPSSFAGGPHLVSPELLVEDGLLDAADFAGAPAKDALLRKAFARFAKEGRGALWDEFRSFHKKHADWLEDWAMYAALSQARKNAPWYEWEPAVRDRRFKEWDRPVLASVGENVTYHQFVQFLFERQWDALRAHCRRLGVDLIGDVPIYAALGSADCWARRDLFRLDAEGRPEAVAGVPPDYFCEDGQLWGNPLYRWERHKEEGWAWWLSRLKQARKRFSAVRLDHFIGFCRYWEVPACAKTAREGRWAPGPGAEFFEAVRRELPDLELIAEDLGAVDEAIFALRDRFALPGMRVLQFAFGTDAQAARFLPENYPPRTVAYTGTHDNDTARGWWETSATPEERGRARRYLGGEGAWSMIRALFKSPANTVIVPLQDFLGLGSSARMNVPGVEKGNWTWRLAPGQLSGGLAGEVKKLVVESRRDQYR